MSVTDLLLGDAPLLAEGSVYERLRRHPDVPFDPHVGTAALVLDERFREVLADVHRGYLRIALDAAAPAGAPIPATRQRQRRQRRQRRTHRPK